MKFFKIKLMSVCLIFSSCLWADLSGDWQGVLDVNGAKIPLIIHLMQENGQQKGTLDSPAQGATGIPMTALEFSDNNLMFEIAEIGIHYEGTLDESSGSIAGNFIQGGVFELSFTPVKPEVLSRTNSSDINDLLGQWGGTIEIPGNPLSFILHVKMNGENLVTTADSPDQDATGLVVDSITIKAGEVIFIMEALDAEFKGFLSEDKKTIKGDFIQRGMVFKLQFTQGSAPQQTYDRPQEPKPPFNYHVEEVTFKNIHANIVLAGTLTRPKDSSSVKAAAVMITGSGPQDRDETIFKHKPFWVIADYLTQQGFAVLRIDDRGVGGSTGDFSQATSEDFVSDISAAVDFLQQRKDVPADKIGLIGHSEGGMIAPMLAAQRSDLSFLVLLAAPGVPITELYAEQKFLIAKAMGQDVKQLEQQRKKDLAFHEKMVVWSGTNDFEREVTNYLTDSMKNEKVGEKQLKHTVENSLKFYNTPWFKFFIAHKPADYLSQVKIPILALNGENDLQVAAVSNLNGIEQTLNQVDHTDFIIKTLPKLNHLFQTSDTGSTSEYGKLTETFSPLALKEISDWLGQRF